MSSALEINKKISQDGSTVYAASSAGSDAYAITLVPAIAAYTTGQIVQFEADVANTGAATLNINGIGAITIKKNHDQDLANNDIESGQIVTVVYDGTNFQMQSQLANSAASASDYVLIASATASASSEIVFTDLSSDYFVYKVYIESMSGATDATFPQMQVSIDNGSSFISSNYLWAYDEISNSGSPGSFLSGASAGTFIQLGGHTGTTAQENSSMEITIYNPSATNYTRVSYIGHHQNHVPVTYSFFGAGVASTASAVDAIRFFMTSGNIAVGNFRLYGIKAS